MQEKLFQKKLAYYTKAMLPNSSVGEKKECALLKQTVWDRTMHTIKKPRTKEEEQAIAKAKMVLCRIQLPEIEEQIHHILCEIADLCIGHIAKELRKAYCEKEKLLLLPTTLIAPVKSTAATLFVKRAIVVNRQLQTMYTIPKEETEKTILKKQE